MYSTFVLLGVCSQELETTLHEFSVGWVGKFFQN